MPGIRGQKVVVTGGAGFIGSHIVESLVHAGAKVLVYDNMSTGILENLKDVMNDIELVPGDILDAEKLTQVCRGAALISHQAAQLEILKAIDLPDEDLRVNTIGTVNVLRAAVASGVEQVINASSACVYGQPVYTPQDENHPQDPNWEYGVSKVAAEKYCKIYEVRFGLKVTSLRYAITFGPREWYRRVLTIFVKRASQGLPPVVFGDGEAVRDFIAVSDVCALHNLCILNPRAYGKILNVGSGVGVSIRELAAMVRSVAGISQPVAFEAVKEGETSRVVEGKIRNSSELKAMVLDSRQACRLVGWSPRVPLEEGIRRLLTWFSLNPGRWESLLYSHRPIGRRSS